MTRSKLLTAALIFFGLALLVSLVGCASKHHASSPHVTRAEILDASLDQTRAVLAPESERIAELEQQLADLSAQLDSLISLQTDISRLSTDLEATQTKLVSFRAALIDALVETGGVLVNPHSGESLALPDPN